MVASAGNMVLDLTREQAASITVAERVTSVFSLLGLSFIILSYKFSKLFRKPINRLMFYAALGDAIYNVGTLIARAGVDAGQDSPLCQLQAWIIELFLLSDTMWNLSMAINVWLTVYKNYDARKLQKLEKWYFCINYGIPLIVASALLIVETKAKGKVYGNALLWCWIDTEWDVLRIALLYGPAWILIITITAVYFVTGLKIHRSRSRLHHFESSADASRSGQRATMVPESNIKTTEVEINVEMSNIPSVNSPIPPLNSPPVCAGANRARYPQYDVRIGGGDRIATKVHGVDTAKQYAKSAMLFFLALVITWLPSTINRVYSLISPNTTNLPLNMTAAIVLPLMGFWNFIIYIINSRKAVRQLYREWRDDFSSWANTFSSRPHSHDSRDSLSAGVAPPSRSKGRFFGHHEQVSLEEIYPSTLHKTFSQSSTTQGASSTTRHSHNATASEATDSSHRPDRDSVNQLPIQHQDV